MSSDSEFIDTRELPEVRYKNEYVKKWSEVAAAGVMALLYAHGEREREADAR